MFNQLADMAINKPMVLPVKIILSDDVGDLIPGMVVQQQPTQHGLLRFNGVRGHFIGFKQRIAAGCGKELSHGLYAAFMSRIGQILPFALVEKIKKGLLTINSPFVWVESRKRSGAASPKTDTTICARRHCATR